MKRFILTPRAAQDVSDIWDYIADDSIEAADRVLDALHSVVVKLAKNPGMGHWREELTDRTNPLQIIRVLHAGRDVQTILRLPPDES